MNLRGLLALVVGAGLAALGCGSETLHGGGQGGSSGPAGAKGGANGGASGVGGAGGRPADGSDGGGCLSDLFVDWLIQSPAGGAVTCDAVHATEVVVNIDGANYPQPCLAGHSSGNQDIVLQQNYAIYEVTINLEDANGDALAVPQTTSISVTSCASYQTPGPAILIVTPPAQQPTGPPVIRDAGGDSSGPVLQGAGPSGGRTSAPRTAPPAARGRARARRRSAPRSSPAQ